MRLNQQIQHLRTVETGINRNLFYICAGVTIVAMAMMVTEFFTRSAFPPTRMSLFYLGVLIIYSLHKEMVRWLGQRKVERQGEYFVYGWIGLTTILYIVNFLTKDYFSYSVQGAYLEPLGEVTTLTIEVLAIFIFTRVLKILRIFFTKRQIFKKLQDGE